MDGDEKSRLRVGPLNGTCVVSPVTAVVRNNMNGFSDFGTAQAPTPLPVELLSFEGTPLVSTIQLSWATATETNNKGFELERSTDAAHFRKIAWTDGHGTTSSLHEYGFEDKEVEKDQRYYYRLKQIDDNHAFQYSPIITAMLHQPGQFSWQVLPNPYSDETKLTYTLNEETIVLAEVLNIAGQVIATLAQGLQQKGNYEYSFSARKAGYATGIYTLRLIVGDKIYNTRLVETE